MSGVGLRLLDYDNVLFVSFVPLWFLFFRLLTSDILISSPILGVPNASEFRTHIGPGERRKYHVTQPRKRDGGQHDLTGQDVQYKGHFIVEPLMVCEKSG